MMQLFVWTSVTDLTTNFHDGGGVVVIAPDLAAARAALEDCVPSACEAFTHAPDYSAQCEAAECRVFVFPNAGCC